MVSVMEQEPIFQEQWKEEFAIDCYRPAAILCVSCIGTILFLFNFVSAVWQDYDGVGGDSAWIFVTWAPNLFSGILNFLSIFLFSLIPFRPFCIKHYNAICTVNITIGYASTVASYLMLEIRRALYQGSGASCVIVRIDFNRFLPVRSCNVTSVNGSLILDMRSPLWQDRGLHMDCNNLILSGGIFSLYVFFNMLPVIYKMNSQAATLVTMVNSLILVSAVISVGTQAGVIFFTTALQFTAGVIATLFCRSRQCLDKKQFAIAKATKIAAEQNSNLLYTLIPENVVAKLASWPAGQLLSTSLDHCTIMFCSLQPQHELQRIFSEDVFLLLNDVFSAFDHTVRRFGMFKYQHVGDWYIVACPRAARPFDEAEQNRPYPHTHTLAMVLLANELRRVAGRYTFRESTTLWLRVGLHCGPVAGAVIGSHRSFYCLYGDTVNTAARMCKYAKESHVHCSGEFAAALAVAVAECGTRASASSLCIRTESRGAHEVKGKGVIETHDIIMDDRPTAAVDGAPPATRPRLLHAARRMVSLVSSQSWQPRPPSIIENILHPGCGPDSSAADEMASQERASDGCAAAGPAAAGKASAGAAKQPQWDDPTYRLHRVWGRFCDLEQEGYYCQDTAGRRRKGLQACLAMHLAVIAVHTYMVTAGDNDEDAGGADGDNGKWRQAAVAAALYGHLGAACAVSAALAVAVRREEAPLGLCECGLVLLKYAHMACSAWCYVTLPADMGWGIVFAVDAALLQGLGGLQFPAAAALAVGALASLAGALAAAGMGVAPFVLAKALVYAAAGMGLSNAAGRTRRLQWRWNCLLEEELDRLNSKLCDLLPPLIASRMLAASTSRAQSRVAAGKVGGGSGSSGSCGGSGGEGWNRRGAGAEEAARTVVAPAVRSWQRGCERCTAVVLQLDICGFTSMSQTLPPIAVAELVHSLFSVFDSEVQVRGLFKMDTVGDAYIVAGFLSAAAGSTAAALSQSFCGDAPPAGGGDGFAKKGGGVGEKGEKGGDTGGRRKSSGGNGLRRLVSAHACRSPSAADCGSRNGDGNAGCGGRSTMRSVCEELLAAAAVMLRTLEEYRAATGRDVHCRIGVSAGPVVAGVLGRLQPRFHIFGEGMRSAERMEQTGRIDSVHAGEPFVQAFRTAAAAAAGRAGLVRDGSVEVFSPAPAPSLPRSPPTVLVPLRTGPALFAAPAFPGTVAPPAPAKTDTTPRTALVLLPRPLLIGRRLAHGMMQRLQLSDSSLCSELGADGGPEPEGPNGSAVPVPRRQLQPDLIGSASMEHASGEAAAAGAAGRSVAPVGNWAPAEWRCEPGPGDGWTLRLAAAGSEVKCPPSPPPGVWCDPPGSPPGGAAGPGLSAGMLSPVLLAACAAGRAGRTAGLRRI